MGQPGGRPVVPSGTYAELRDPDGAVAGHDPALGLDQRPRPARRPRPRPATRRLLTTGSTEGSGRWRVSVTPSDHRDGNTVVVAVPMDELDGVAATAWC